MDQQASSDLVRLHEFLENVNKPAAARVVKSLTVAAKGLVVNPHIGESLQEFKPAEVRRLLVDHYEIRYEIVGSTIYVLRLWHDREKR